ncbi:MAG: LPS-assembly protein LptD [Myxococcales bacterium]|nr:LPS-assembly protein LptD [Myxococcales bacterium]
MPRASQSVLAGLLLLAPLPAGSAAKEGGFLRDAAFTLHADEVSYEPKRELYEATGNVRVEQEGGATLTADWLVFNATTRVGVASGNVRIRDGEDTLVADFTTVDLDTLVAIATDATLDAGTPGFVVTGDPVHKTGTNTYQVDDASFTTCRCPPDGRCPPWDIEAKHAEIRVGGYAVVRDATFNIRGIPILYMPWMILPVKTERQTGFLIPSLASDSTNGLELEIPFFWAARDNLNVLLRPSYYSKRGYKPGAEFEYLFGEEAFTRGGAAILPNDREVERSDPTTPYSDDRWTYWLRHHQPLGEDLLFGADVERVSDNDYVVEFEDLPPETRHSRYLESSVWGIANRGALYLDGQLMHFDDLQSPDNLDRDDFILHRLPDVEFASLPRHLGRLPFWAGVGARYTHFYQQGDRGREGGTAPLSGQFFDTGIDGLFDSDEPNPQTGLVDGAPDNSMDNAATVAGGTEGNGIFDEGELLADDGHRLDLFPRVSLPWRFGPLETLSEVGFRETLYWADHAGSERREIWTARFDVRSRFQRSFELDSLELHHLVEPKLAFVLVSTPSQSDNPLFIPRGAVRPVRQINWDGRLLTRNPSDRIEDERLLQFSLGSRFFTAPAGAGHVAQQVGTLRLGSGYDFQRGRMADIFLSGTFTHWARLNLYGLIGYDPKNTRLQETGAGLSWQGQGGHELALSYRYLREFSDSFQNFDFDDNVFGKADDDVNRVNQLNLRARWILTQRLELFGDGYVSLNDSSSSEGTVGLVIRSRCDCWELVGEVARRTRPDDTRFQLHVNLTGLGRTF